MMIIGIIVGSILLVFVLYLLARITGYAWWKSYFEAKFNVIQRLRNEEKEEEKDDRNC